MSEVGEQPPANVEPLKGKQLDQALKDLARERRVKPEVVSRFLAIDTEEIQSWPKVLGELAIPSGLLLTHLITLANVESLPPMGELPPRLHEFFQAVHNLTVNAARSPALKDHLPFLLLEAAPVWGFARTTPEVLKIRGKKGKIRELQKQTAEKAKAGELPFAMAEGHTAAFVGGGDLFADRLQEVKAADEVIQYAHLPLTTQVWQAIEKAGHQEKLFSALDHGDFTKAGEVLMLPVVEEDMFLPGEEGHDMSLDEMRALVSVLDAYCEARSVAKKRVVIVGRRTMVQEYAELGPGTKLERSRKFLHGLARELTDERGVEVEIIDPTELVMERIAKLSGGKTLNIYGTKESVERYGERFYAALGEMDYTVTEPNEIVRVLYNVSDVPTEVEATPDDIAIILDASRKQSLLDNGLPESQVIVVPDLVLDHLSLEVEES